MQAHETANILARLTFIPKNKNILKLQSRDDNGAYGGRESVAERFARYIRIKPYISLKANPRPEKLSIFPKARFSELLPI